MSRIGIEIRLSFRPVGRSQPVKYGHKHKGLLGRRGKLLFLQRYTTYDMEILAKQNMEYNILVDNIGNLLQSARNQVATAVNTALVQTYWHIGKYIVEYEQQGNERAEYGSNLLATLSRDLSRLYGKGFSHSNINKMRKLYISFPILQTLSAKLSWSHYVEILKADDPLEIAFYSKECEKENWSVRELKRQLDSMLFHRLALSTDKEGVLKLSQEGVEVQKPDDIIHDPYVLEFVGLPDEPRYKEGDLEQALVDNLSLFLLELGKGFAFIRKQYRISLNGRHFYVDLVFYNVVLKCYVLIDLKRNEIQHEDIGQMNLYLNYFKNEVCTEGDADPIGIVLGAKKDKLMVQYATQGITNNLFAARYQLYLPKREELEQELQRILDGNQD